jgi:hypothetical protein
MSPTSKTPAGKAGASRDSCGGRSHSLFTVSDMQAQLLAARFRLSPWMAHDMAEHCFGSAWS